MKKFATIALSAALLLTLFAGCGAKETAPETTAPMETGDIADGTQSTEAAELSELGKLIEKIYENHAEVELPLMTQDLDLTNMDLVTMNTGLTSVDKVSAIAVSAGQGSHHQRRAGNHHAHRLRQRHHRSAGQADEGMRGRMHRYRPPCHRPLQ